MGFESLHTEDSLGKSPELSGVIGTQRKQVFGLKSSGGGALGRGAQIRRPEGSRGRGSAATGLLEVRVPFPHPLELQYACSGRAGLSSLLSVLGLLGIVVRTRQQKLYLAALGPQFPEGPEDTLKCSWFWSSEPGKGGA